jgi:general nucleoside transport system permease protein
MENKFSLFKKPDLFKKSDTPFYKKEGFVKCIASILCVLASLLICLIVLIFLDIQNGCENVFYEFGVMLSGGLSFSSTQGFFNILRDTAPLLCSGLAICFAYKSGMFNIGAAGQYVMGMFGGLLLALTTNCHWTLCILLAIVFGAIWGAIPGILKALFNVSEVIGGIMLNWIGLFFVNYSWQTYLRSCLNSKTGFKTNVVSGISKIPTIDFGSTSLSISIIFAVVAAILVWFIMNKTILGFQLRASGLNKDATKYAGMNEKRNIILSMAIAGGLAGLGGGLYYLSGISEWEGTISTSLPGVPWNGIVVAFIGQINPIATIVSSFFISFISYGAKFMTQNVFPSEIADLVTGIIVYLSGLSTFLVVLINNNNKNKHIDKILADIKLHHQEVVSGIKQLHTRIRLKTKKDNVESSESINSVTDSANSKPSVENIDIQNKDLKDESINTNENSNKEDK